MAAKPIGRISVARITDDWADTQALNPRALAFEMADALRSMSQPGASVPRDKALVMGVASNEDGADELTWHALADYFDSFGNGDRPNRIITLRGECVPSALLLDRAWIERLTNEAVTRAEIAAGYAQALPSAPATIGAAALAPQQPVTPSGSAPVCLKIREAQQRREGEASAAEQLDAERTARNQSEQEASRLRAKLEAIETLLHQERESIEGLRRELNESERARGRLAEQLIEAKQKTDEAAASAAAAFSRLEGQLNHVASLFSGRQATPAQGAGLSFPYATKELEAMRAAVAQYWEGYTTDKRQPTQKAVALTLGEMLGLPQQGSGDAARKAITLASAIKPDTLPDA